MHVVSEDSGVSSCFPSLTPSSSVCGGFRLYDLVGDQVLGVGLWVAQRRSLTLCNRQSTFPSYTELKIDSFIYIFSTITLSWCIWNVLFIKGFMTISHSQKLCSCSSPTPFIFTESFETFSCTRGWWKQISLETTPRPQTSSELSSFSLSLLWRAAGRPGTEFKLKTMRDVSTRAHRHLSACLHLQEDGSKCDTLTL